MSATDTLNKTSLEFREVPGFSNLIRSYCSQPDPLSRFFVQPPFPVLEKLQALASKVQAIDRDRPALAQILTAQNERWGGDGLVLQNVNHLGRSGSFAVVTGQQVGLFGGPAYTLYKALSAVKIARRWGEELNTPVIPVFWLADEDHDFGEVKSITVPEKDQLFSIELPVAYPANAPVGRMRFDYSDLRSEFVTATDGLVGSELVNDILEATYVDGDTLSDCFARLLTHVMAGTGMVLISADDPGIKRLGSATLVKGYEEHASINASVETQTAALIAAGFHGQLQPRGTNLFFLSDEERSPIRTTDSGEIAMADRVLTQTEFGIELRENPESVSPNVVLRPLMQDSILPTLGYVAGPGEIAYFAQLAPVYQQLGVPMPVIAPRESYTLASNRQMEFLDSQGIGLSELAEIDKTLADLAVASMPGEWSHKLESLREALASGMGSIESEVTPIELTLKRSTRSSLALIEKILGRYEKRLVRALKRRDKQRQDRLRRSGKFLLPDGKLQERTFPFVFLLAKYGLGLVDTILDDENDRADKHFLLRL